MIETIGAISTYLMISLLLVWRDRYLRDVPIHPWLEYSLAVLFGVVAGLFVQLEYSSFVFGVIAALIAACVGILISEGVHKWLVR
ncbi:hypothetical protein [Litoribrevibacter albus]|uniref:hypothetical protein n=1 Tax=Litoribrevibacter albus TaxID=1473156 RepID=UPI0024E15E39|nr:hypothetical protein [Litoribrevibacter albus]